MNSEEEIKQWLKRNNTAKKLWALRAQVKSLKEESQKNREEIKEELKNEFLEKISDGIVQVFKMGVDCGSDKKKIEEMQETIDMLRKMMNINSIIFDRLEDKHKRATRNIAKLKGKHERATRHIAEFKENCNFWIDEVIKFQKKRKATVKKLLILRLQNKQLKEELEENQALKAEKEGE